VADAVLRPATLVGCVQALVQFFGQDTVVGSVLFELWVI